MGFLKNISGFFGKKDNGIEKDQIDNSVRLLSAEEEPEVEIVRGSSEAFGNYQYSIDFNSTAETIQQLIKEYRRISKYPEVDEAIQEIVNEVIVQDGNLPLKVDIDSGDIKEKLKEAISREFLNILSMLDFKNRGDEHFRQWYEDGRLYLQNVIDTKNPHLGIQDIKVLSPFNLKRIKEDNKIFFIYDDKKSPDVLKISSDHITFIHSTLTDENKNFYIGYLDKVIRPYNQLKLLEDSAIIYRFTRAPERRVFYIDVGKMNKSKAESYIAGIIAKFKNKITYDSVTGKVDQRKNVMSMTEDFWLPSSESSGGSRGTKVDVLPGGTQLGELEDLKYFQSKLKKSLNVPFSRFDSDSGSALTFGNMNGEMSRDEVRFSKFINKLRYNFSRGIIDILKKQLILKKVITVEDWEEIKDSIVLIWNSDSYFSEVKEAEIQKNRIELAESLNPFIGKYFSHEYIQKNIFKMTDEEIKEETKKINKEKNNPLLKVSEEY